MTLARSAFGGAFLLIIAGSLAARSAVAPLFHGLGSSGPRSVLAARDTPKASPSLIVISPAHPSPGSTTPSPVERRRIGRPAPTPTPPATLRPTSTPAPSATPASGTLALLRYWVGTPAARPGQTIEVGYVIDNGTGRTMHEVLGVSLKSSRALSWATSAVSDPGHDVVATVLPGTSTHIRFFTLPPGLRPGWYDVAWGLRSPITGARVGLVFAPTALRVRG
ncbi:MAG TPA: hypothetical protein VKX16_00020 [Chloroflexota bacterium]|nr:hypothetical protein [Chloroflexota bacterium]